MQYADEQKLVAECKANSRLAQRTVYERYAPLFFTISKRYGKNNVDAEQILQDAFLKIFTQIHQYESKGSFEGWMKRILVNTCLDFVKSKQFKKDEMTIYPEVISHAVDKVSWNEVITKIDQEPLLVFIQSLPPMTRTVFNLFVFEGYNHKEIAVALGMSEGTSQWHVSSARAILKKKISKLYQFEQLGHEETQTG